MATSLKRLCLVITLFIFTEISNEQQAHTVPNSEALRNGEKTLNGSTVPLHELTRDGRTSIKDNASHLQDPNSNLEKRETIIKGQTTQPKRDGMTIRNGGSLIQTTGGLSQSAQDRTNLTNGRGEINNLFKQHVKGANSITGEERMVIVNGNSNFNGGLLQSKQERRKLIDEKASLGKGEKMIYRQTTRRKQAKMMFGKGESRVKEGSRQSEQLRSKLIEGQKKIKRRWKGEKKINEQTPQRQEDKKVFTNAESRKKGMHRQPKQALKGLIKRKLKISMSSGRSNQRKKNLRGKDVINGKSMLPKQKENVFRKDVVEREKIPAQHKLKKQRLKSGETTVDKLRTQKRKPNKGGKQGINKRKRQSKEGNKNLKKGKATTETPHKQSKRERIVLQNGDTMVRKPKKVRLRRIYRTMNVYYQKGMTLDEARARSKYVDNVVLDMEKESTTQVISKGKTYFLKWVSG